MPFPLSLLSRLSNEQLRTSAQAYRWKASAASVPEIRDALIRVAERFERAIAQRAEAQQQRYRPAAIDTSGATEGVEPAPVSSAAHSASR